MSYYAKQVDSNQKAIVDALRKIGCSVFVASTVGKGFPDLVVGKQGETFLVECKVKKGRLTPAQEDFQSLWRGGKVIIVRSVEDALSVFGCLN